MRIVLHTIIISPHQLPFAAELAKIVGDDNFRYVYVDELHEERSSLGWANADADWIIRENSEEGREWLESADVLITGRRVVDLLKRRSARGLFSFYAAERWFKPLRLKMPLVGNIDLPGRLRMFIPSYRRMATDFVAWIKKDCRAKILAFGPLAVNDMLHMGIREERILDWGYYVEPSSRHEKHNREGALKVLWVGRMIDWKRVDTIIKAIGCVSGVTLTIVGKGDQKPKLQRLARDLPVEFLDAVPINKIRPLMRRHDLYVLSSDENEGWGAALNEALEEGMSAIGTFEAGASAAMLPNERLYHAGDWRTLSELIKREQRGELPPCSIGKWTAKSAARRFMELIK